MSFRAEASEKRNRLEDVVMAERYQKENALSRDLPLPGPEIVLSVVIPAYNEAAKIRRTLESFNLQTRQGFEVIIVDNGSSDETREIVCRFAAEEAQYPLYLLSEIKQGPGNARRRGMDQSAIRQSEDRGARYIAGTDGDSVPLPDWVEGIISSFESTGADLLIGDIYYYHEINDPKFIPLHYLDAVRQVTSKYIMPRLRGINFAVDIQAYMKAGGIKQPLTPEGHWAPNEEGTLRRGIEKFDGNIQHMSTLVDGDPRRFLDNLAQGKRGSMALYGIGDQMNVTDIRIDDTDELLSRVTDEDITLFVERQLKNIFRKDVVEIKKNKSRAEKYWPKIRKLLGDMADEFEAEIEEKQGDIDYLWSKYGEEFITQVNYLIETEGERS